MANSVRTAAPSTGSFGHVQPGTLEEEGSRFELRVALAVALLIAAAGLSVHVLLQHRQTLASTPIETHVGDQLVDLSQPAAALARELARGYLREPVSFTFGRTVRRRTRAALGVQVDLESLSAMLEAANDPDSALRRLHRQTNASAPLALSISAKLQGDQAERWLRGLARELDRPALAPRVERESGRVLAAQPGQQLDVAATLDALELALDEDAHALTGTLRTLAPSRTATRDLKRIDVSTLLGSFETVRVDASATWVRNLQRIASVLDGLLILPGETFGFRTALAELRAARELDVDKWSANEGSGTNAALEQFASTLHASALFAGLPIVERHASAHAPSHIEAGLEASLTSEHDLRFRNDFERPLALFVDVREGHLLAGLRGAGEGAREVELMRTIEAVTPVDELSRSDSSLPVGVSQLGQAGSAGFQALLTRNVRDRQREELLREEHIDTYAARPIVLRVGSGSAALPVAAAQARLRREQALPDEQLLLSMQVGDLLPIEGPRASDAHASAISNTAIAGTESSAMR